MTAGSESELHMRSIEGGKDAFLAEPVERGRPRAAPMGWARREYPAA